MKLSGTELGFGHIKEGDAIIINGNIASHGVAIISARENLKFNIASDCESLSVTDASCSRRRRRRPAR